MKEKTTKTDVGVIVARFQVHNLTSVHTDLIQTVVDKHNKVLIFLGLSPIICDRVNSLDFESRKQMVLEKFPSATVLYIKDVKDDDIWSKRLDEQISDMLTPGQTATLYGGRDAFIKHYSGRYSVIEFEPISYISGTELRKEIGSKVKASSDFRGGVIWNAFNRWPMTIVTVDAIIYDERGRILLVRKVNEKLFRFPGGYSEPDTDDFNADILREIGEETGVEVGDLKILGTMKIDDWRYWQSDDKIKTIIFSAKYIFGHPHAKDTAEIAEVRWFSIAEMSGKELVSEHLPIYEKYVYDLHIQQVVENGKC